MRADGCMQRKKIGWSDFLTRLSLTQTIIITGTNEKDVKAAEQCFQVLQAVYVSLVKQFSVRAPQCESNVANVFCHKYRNA